MWRIEDSALGRIAIPPVIPAGFAVFATTLDYHGRITPDLANGITGVVRERFDLTTTLTTCTQVHGARVERACGGVAPAPSPAGAPAPHTMWKECDSCDALWSDEKGVSIAIKVADCLPVVMIDPIHSVIANVHSGWRGAVHRITAAAIDAVERATPFDAAGALAYLGPSIRVCCFEVGEEVATQFDARYVEHTQVKPHVDLIALTVDLLRARGFAAERIFDSGLCTRCEGSIFHSYRRDGGRGGRNLAIAAQ